MGLTVWPEKSMGTPLVFTHVSWKCWRINTHGACLTSEGWVWRKRFSLNTQLIKLQKVLLAWAPADHRGNQHPLMLTFPPSLIDSLLGYLLLCQKLPQNLVTSNNKSYCFSHLLFILYLFSHFCGHLIRSSSSLVVLAQSLSWGWEMQVKYQSRLHSSGLELESPPLNLLMWLWTGILGASSHGLLLISWQLAFPRVSDPRKRPR